MLLHFNTRHHLLARRFSHSSTPTPSSAPPPATATTFLHHFLTTFLSTSSSPSTLLQSHALLITTGHSSSSPHFAAKLISLYPNSPHSASKIFSNVVGPKDTFLFNSIIKSHFSASNYPESIRLYFEMRLSGFLPNDFTAPMIASACAETADVESGVSFHGLVVKLGMMILGCGNAVVGGSLVYMYGKFEKMWDARKVFDEIPVRDVVAWTALVVGYVRNGEAGMGLRVFCEMVRVGEGPNERTVEGGFMACGDLMGLTEGKCLHGFGIKTGLVRWRDVESAVLGFYSKCGDDPEDAWMVFCEIGDKDLLSWTAVIAAYAKQGRVNECLCLFTAMLDAGVCPDGIVVSCVASCFDGDLRAREGKTLHGLVIRRECFLDQVAVNALISMYCRFHMPLAAEKLFDGGHERDSESWNLMVCGYAKGGLEGKCRDFFRQMQRRGIDCYAATIVSVIALCSQVSASHLGRSLHCHTIKSSLDKSVSVSNSLIDMYGKCGKLAVARRIFCRTEGDTVTWNSMISVNTHQGHWVDALELFDRMVEEGPAPNSATLVTVLSACSHLASFEKTERIHEHIQTAGIDSSLPLATALLDAYGKCGHVEKSRQIFKAMPEKDVVSWNVMISCYGMHGDAISAVSIFNEMEESCVRPNGLTFLAVLSACSHAGLVEEGKYLFARMHEYSVTPTLKHYACMVDLLGKSGNLSEAEDMVTSMPFAPDGGIWGSLLAACKLHNDVEMGIRVAIRATESDPDHDGYYIILSNMFDSIGSREEAEKVREVMKQRGVQKSVGWSAL